MCRTILLSALLLAATPLPALALDCEEPLTQVDMNICAGQDYERSDTALNAAYRQLMEHLSGDDEARNLLRDAQRAWIAFRDAECDFTTSGSREGSIHPMLMAGCLTDMTNQRTDALRALLECDDLACP